MLPFVRHVLRNWLRSLLTNRDIVYLSDVSIQNCSTNDMSHNLKSYSNGSLFPSMSPGMLRLYSMRFCPFAQRTRLVLEYKQIPYQTININLKDKPDWFLSRNPLGLVPVLEHDGRVVYESLVCDNYLDEVHPDPRLGPSDPYLKARDMILRHTSSNLHTLWSRILKSGGTDGVSGQKFLAAVAEYEDILRQRGDFFGGASPSLLDFTIWPWFERMGVMDTIAPDYAITTDRFPYLCRWRNRMFQRPEVEATMFDTDTHLAFLKSFLSGRPQYDIGLTPASGL